MTFYTRLDNAVATYGSVTLARKDVEPRPVVLHRGKPEINSKPYIAIADGRIIAEDSTSVRGILGKLTDTKYRTTPPLAQYFSDWTQYGLHVKLAHVEGVRIIELTAPVSGENIIIVEEACVQGFKKPLIGIASHLKLSEYTLLTKAARTLVERGQPLLF